MEIYFRSAQRGINMSFEQEQLFVAETRKYVTDTLSLGDMEDEELEERIEEIVIQRIGSQYCPIEQKVSIRYTALSGG